jgi:dihydrolipoamide dehydrogenase
MEKFDVIVIGSGSGMKVVWSALLEGLKVALVEKGPLGGTCLNNGCIPSKVMIYPADVVSTLADARSVGIEGAVNKVDFSLIMRRVWDIIERERRGTEEEVESQENLTWYKETAEFVGDYTLRVGGETIMAPKICIATGSRPGVPPVPGLKESGYLNNVTLLGLKKLPPSMIIIGAGYIGCEYGHCFSALGTKVTLIGRHPVVLDDEDPEISAIVTKVLSRDLAFAANHDADHVELEGDKKVVYAKDVKSGRVERFEADEILVATGRVPNADLLRPDATGVEADRKGWVRVDKYLETTRHGIYALGDATGRYMFKHTANYEAGVVSDNMLRNKKRIFDTHAVPHAVFTHPQVGSVGMTEAEAIKSGKNILVGRASYADTAKGYAMGGVEGLVKVVVENGTNKILGCSIVGPEAPILVQQVVFLMNADREDMTPLERSQVIHPALSEVLANAFAHLESPSLLAPKR